MSADPRTALEVARSAAGLDKPDRPLTPEEVLSGLSPEQVGERVAAAERERQRRLAEQSDLLPEDQIAANAD